MAAPRDFDPDLKRAFDTIRPLLVKACDPIAKSMKEIEEDYGIRVTDAELEINFQIGSAGVPYVVSSKQESSISIKLRLEPRSLS